MNNFFEKILRNAQQMLAKVETPNQCSREALSAICVGTALAYPPNKKCKDGFKNRLN